MRRAGAAAGEAIRTLRAAGAMLAVTTVAATAALGCSGDEEVGRVQAAVNGDIDDGSFPGVMGLFVNKPEGVARCSGVLIAPNLVLTARHCVAPTTASFVDCGSSPLGTAVAPAEALATTDGTMPPDDRSVYRAAIRIEVPADGDDECGFDIAALVLEESVPESEATPFPPRLDRAVLSGERFTAVGFGSSPSGGMGVRRVRPDHGVVCVGDTECAEEQVQATEWLAEDDGFCRFDSGAPAIGAGGEVLGVVSRGANTCDAPILSATYAWASWLRGVGVEAAETGGYATPAWAEALPPEDDGGVPADGGTIDSGDGDADGGGGPDGGPPATGDTGGCSASRADSGTWPAMGGIAMALFLLCRRRRTPRRQP